MIATTVIDEIQKVFPLQADEVLKLQLLLAQGHQIIATGVTVWFDTKAGDRVRTTNQINAPGLVRLPDGSPYLRELMHDLDEMEDDHLPELIDKALYFYTKDKAGIRFHSFTRQ